MIRRIEVALRFRTRLKLVLADIFKLLSDLAQLSDVPDVAGRPAVRRLCHRKSLFF